MRHSTLLVACIMVFAEVELVVDVGENKTYGASGSARLECIDMGSLRRACVACIALLFVNCPDMHIVKVVLTRGIGYYSYS